ncbi:hypothetical protein DDE82_007884 [Stemphylium lycopersici]|nr:hypothetical protein TW65_04867 [Stemphylium lycopersici]RAQ99814.1 hypothetical protein DDE82_007884 [Stemphylium lycopersici]
MATTMLAGFTSSDRRKKVVYGKSSRLSTLPPPAPASSDDAPPSPERPRKHVSASNASLKKAAGALETGNSLGNTRAKSPHVDIFDVPSEDDFIARPKPTKKLVAKPRTHEEGAGRPNKLAKPTRPLPRPEAANPNAVAKKPQKPAQLLKSSQAPPPSSSSSDPIAPWPFRAKTPQPADAPKQTATSAASAKPTAPKARAASQAATSLPSDVAKVQKNAKTSSALPPKKLPAKPATKLAQDVNVFHVPSSEDEAPVTAVKKAPRQAEAARRRRKNEQTKVPPPALDVTHKESIESDDSSSSRKRKRKGPVSSTATVARPAPQKSRKSQKKEDADSPRHASLANTSARASRDTPSATVQSTAPVTNKPRRTRQRTVPVLGPPKATKGQSSPATLAGMISSRQPDKPSPVAESHELAGVEDQTMYDIPEPLATPVRAPKTAVPGSTTPRQRNLFGGLLGESPSTSTPMPSLSNLQLTDRKPKSLIGSLSRSKSDVSHSAQARKTRLIDTLKPVESSSEDEEEEETSSEGTREPDERAATARAASKPSQEPHGEPAPIVLPSDDMDIDVQANADSQTSQATSAFGMRPKLTYAMSRSYLRETNPEDDLIITMDLDDDFGPQSQSKDTVSVSEDDPDPASQAQAHHELKSRGRNYVFQQEAQTMIDDISSTTTSSIRRSAMIELCTKMADESFCSQLLDSPLAQQFFRNISVGGEVIFEFATAVATVFILRSNPSYTVLDQLYETGILINMFKLVGKELDIQKIAKDRKTNLSKISKDAVMTFRSLILQSSIWSPAAISKVSPQLVSMKAVELLVTGLRKAGNAETLLDQPMVSQLAAIATASDQRLSTNEGTSEDGAILAMVLSTLESVSATRQKQAIWPVGVLQRITDFLPRFFEADAPASTMLAVKLCMNITNNKPKACQPFSAKSFVQPLVHSIIERFQSLHSGSAPEKQTETLESLILSLGATINLAEFSEQMRLNVDDNESTVETLVGIFLEGSERASQAKSVEESHSGVAIGYLAVLLGNLCLSDSVRSQICMLLPDQQLTMLIDSIKEFVRVHEHVDRKAHDFEGTEGQEASQNYTARLMHVVERLQSAA